MEMKDFKFPHLVRVHITECLFANLIPTNEEAERMNKILDESFRKGNIWTIEQSYTTKEFINGQR